MCGPESTVQTCREAGIVSGRESAGDGQPNSSPAERGDAGEMRAQLDLLEDEISLLRRKLADSPRSVRLLEERLADAQTTLAGVTGQNERLVSTLKEAREQIIALREEVDRLAQ